MKLAIIGSRNFTDYQHLCRVLDAIHDKIKITLVVSGGARGADSFAEKWAQSKSIETKIFLPDWNLHGKKAGILRNTDIINECDAVVAFWDGKSRGTEHSLSLAKKLNKKCLTVVF